MVIVEQCRISNDGKKFIIEAVVENLNYYKDVYIKNIFIDTDDTYSPNGPSSNPVFHKEFEPNTKRVRLCLSTVDFENVSNFDTNIFFVYIMCEGRPSPDTPCGMDNECTMSATVNLRPIYNMAMKYIKELDSDCSIPKGFIDMVLRMKALELSFRTGNYPIAFKQWNKLFKNKIGISPNKKCGCNGIN